MKLFKIKSFRPSSVTKFRIMSVVYIALFWTLIDYIVVILRNPEGLPKHTNSLGIREIFIFIVSLLMGYLFVFKFRRILKNAPLWLNFFIKSAILLGSALLITFVITFITGVLFLHQSYSQSYQHIIDYALYKDWLLQKILYWIIIFFITQLFLLINEKYSPGVFIDILMGRYIQPKIENRIVMFMDLKDSTPIAEKLGHQVYFKFIRDFIYQASMAVIEFNGKIYQYVGDEIIASWIVEKNNSRKCMDTVIECRRNIQKNSEYFRREYGIIPEFRVGIHLGDVTVGEIGVIKKDLAMSGDTMNTTARIRSVCNELNQKFIVSKDFKENIGLEDWQCETLGIIELKGKGSGVELFALKI